MSVYPQFLQRVHDLGMYVVGYNYEEMYNIMVHNLTNNLPLTNNFIFTHNQMNEIYEYLDELLYDPPQSDADTETNQAANQYQDQDTIYPENQDQNQTQNQTALQLFNTYLAQTLHNQYSINTTNILNNFNTTNTLNDEDEIYDNDEITYTNLVYYDNTNS
jgi:hypothetical protein